MPSFHQQIQVELRKGDKTKFWTDSGAATVSFQKFPRFFRLSGYVDSLVADFGLMRRPFLSCHLSLCRFTIQSRTYVSEVLWEISRWRSCSSYWGCSKCSIKSQQGWPKKMVMWQGEVVSSEFIKGPATSGEFLYKLVWKSLASSKVNCFRLADVWAKLNVFHIVQKKNPHLPLSPPACPLNFEWL